jgi:predicted MFS family arabinose efflux permease
MALASGVGVANLYFPQAITPLLARSLHVSDGSAAFVATIAQLGYVVGVFLLVPLGDRLPRKPLIATLFGLVSIGLFVAGSAHSLTLLCVASALIGLVTVVPQILIPMAADLAGPGQSGSVVGIVQGGLLGGILLARAFGGTLGEWFGWRAPYLVSGTLAVLVALALVALLPSTKVTSSQHYPALVFGVVALVGAASVFCVPLSGRFTDRRGPDLVNLICFAGMAVSAAVLLAGLLHGAVGLVALVAGMLLLDISVQASQVANQSRVFALVPHARSRLNSAYMTCVFLGGSAGSVIGARVYIDLGWGAVCGLVALSAAIGFARHVPVLSRLAA